MIPILTKTKVNEPVIAGGTALGFLLAGLTLLGLVIGGLARAAELSSLQAIAFGLAYLAGGVPAGIKAASTLFQKRKLDVDLLMVIAALGALAVGEAMDGAILLFLFSLSNALQAWALGRTANAIRALQKLYPERVTVLDIDGHEREIKLEQIQTGDLLLIKPGERFAADGIIEKGSSSADESAITGESVPRELEPGMNVHSGTLNGSGALTVRASKPAGESTLAQLVKLVEQARTAKGSFETFAERFEGPYTTSVLVMTALVFLALNFVFGLATHDAFYRAMTFLVVASPCAVVIATPAAMLSAMAAGARMGVLFRSGRALEALASVRTIAIDKTGTLTRGAMVLKRLEVIQGDESLVLQLAAGLERHSEHPIAQAIVTAAKERNLEATKVETAQAIPGKGIIGTYEGGQVWAGTRRLATQEGALTASLETKLDQLEQAGLTTVILGQNDKVLGLLGIADEARLEAKPALEALKARHLRLVMLTGDRQAVAKQIASELGGLEVHAELLPEAKLELLETLTQQPTAMVGDGVNDAPALERATVGIAMGSGTDVALQAADVMLVRNDLGALVGAFDLARATAQTVKFNLSFALGIIVLVGLLSLFGIIPLPLGVIAHEGGTLFVVAVGLRLLAWPSLLRAQR